MRKKHHKNLNLAEHREHLIPILQELVDQEVLPAKKVDAFVNRVVRKYPRPDGGLYGRSDLIYAYRELAGTADLPAFDEAILERLRRKPMRTRSGVTVVTILTKPFPCPGQCIFCPNDIRMPKSYLSDEPGAMRAEQNSFDPYLQTYTRLQTYYNTGHPTDKIELIILGGTWSFYPESYQIWFIKRAFDAMHDFGKGIDRRLDVQVALKEHSPFHPEQARSNVTVHGLEMQQNYNQVINSLYHQEMQRAERLRQTLESTPAERSPIDEYATWEELEAAHLENETAVCRCVGLVVETRPDHISEEEVLKTRRLGCTKVQIGFQSLNDDVLRLNKRGHKVAATRRAVRLLRLAGFKIHAHWMPNLYGSSPEADIEDYAKLFDDPDFRPDELKIYPCSLIESAELMQRYEDGSWQPYTHDELLYVLTEAFKRTPEYCRLTRVIRDIPSTDIVVGNQLTNFRQITENELARQGVKSPDIRAREIGSRQVTMDDLQLDALHYDGACADEIFLQFITEDRMIAGFLRLSLPKEAPLTPELNGAAMIREIHVYGQSVEIGEAGDGNAQHLGLGKQLIERAVEIARERGYQSLAVISAIGTREYYRKRGFNDGKLYQLRPLI